MFLINFLVNVIIKNALLAQMELNPPENLTLPPAMDLSTQVSSQLSYFKLGELYPIAYLYIFDP